MQTSPSGAGYTISLTTAYAGTKSAQNTWGGVITGGLNNLGTWLHVGQTGAGIIVMMGITIAMCMVVYNRFHSAIAVEVIAIFLPVLGIYFGIMPMAVGLIITVGIAVIGLYYIFTRGIL